jgi:hypothetical protein
VTADLVAFLRERLDEDEDRANRQRAVLDELERLRDPHAVNAIMVMPFDELDSPSDPARVLAEVDAKRRIIEHSERAAELAKIGPAAADGAWFLALRYLALPYAGHADYRLEWRP